MNKWTSIKEKLPDTSKNVLVYGEFGFAVGYYQGGSWWIIFDEDGWDDEITHWQPLPEPPTL